MTLKQLQRYLETEKWRETAKRGTDVCGSYARCAFCNRYDEYPCAEAYNRYISAPVKEEGDWLLPEPPVRRVFGEEAASEPRLVPVRQPEPKHERSEGIPIQHFVRRVEPQPAVAVPQPPVQAVLPQQAEAVKRGGVIVRSRKNTERTRILVITRKTNIN